MLPGFAFQKRNVRLGFRMVFRRKRQKINASPDRLLGSARLQKIDRLGGYASTDFSRG